MPRQSKHLSNTTLNQIAHDRAFLKFSCYSNRQSALATVGGVYEYKEVLCVELLSSLLTPLYLSFLAKSC